MLKGEKLGAAIEAARIKKGISKAEMARHFGVKPPSVQGWVKYGRISKDMLPRVIRYFANEVGADHWGIEPGDPYAPDNLVQLRPKLSAAEGMVVIDRLSVQAGMGAGKLAEHFPDVIDNLRVSKDWLRRNATFTSMKNLGLVTGLGDSMEPTFSDGDALLVDRGVRDVKVDAVYVLSLNDELYIKRVQRRPDGAWLMISDNPSYEPYVIENGDRDHFQVEGRVVFAWNGRKL
ncbi:MAG: helix-turn-helix transcriptional regulator [Stenotrophomonas sp.]|uniref:LexA family transcriptional regulator n=1 Tax=Stenotrophomonas sp. TaxID=69392 RepID=UPI0013562329|nr:XRE family transcriptional regulator [Stenotrophomonas sp.]MTI72559.1 helix-turn-helix transcriptional regulator [Stenotrophomonas sp.]MTI72619.1 helix-turn-helix transcriptional regulator [Stenotrophomonas sp.]